MTSSVAQQCIALSSNGGLSSLRSFCVGSRSSLWNTAENSKPDRSHHVESEKQVASSEESLRSETTGLVGESNTFPRYSKPKFWKHSEEEEVDELTDGMELHVNTGVKKVSFGDQVTALSVQGRSNSMEEKPELMSYHSVNNSPVSTLPPDVQSHLIHYPRRGSDGAMGRGVMKNRSRSVVIKLQVPSKLSSPGIQRRQIPHGLESKSSPDIRGRAMTYAGESAIASRNNVQVEPKSPTPILSVDETEDDDKFNDGFSSFPSRLPPIKRNSFLYLSDTEDCSPSKTASRSSSISNNNLFGSSDEIYITPFAQILANLQFVRNQFITLTNPPITEERKQKLHWMHPSPSKKLTEEEYKSLALATLDELESCIHRLETVNSAKSMGTMAQDKFRRILSRELTHLSERSKSGHFVAEWVNNLTGSSQADYDEIDKTLDTMNVVQSSLGIESTLSSKPPRRRTVSVNDEIPRFGIVGKDVNYEAMHKFIDTKLDEWEFDAFEWNFLSGSQPLVSLAYTIFSMRGLFSDFKIPKQKFINFMGTVQNNYWSKNAYHNAIHAADVLHATNYLLGAGALENVFTNLEIMASLVAAAVHDVDHPGRNNQFLINTSHELAIMYNDESILENHHLAVAFKVLKDHSCNFLENLESAQLKAFRRMVIDNVLATDMTKHLKHLGELKTKVETKKVANEGILHLDKFQDRSEVLQCLMHCADLSNPAKPPDIASSWAYRIMEESFEQGDEEKKLCIDIGPLGDRENVCVEKCQVSFIDFVIYPLWETWAELVYPDAQPILENLAKTREYWSNRVVVSPLPNEEEQATDRKTSDSGVSNTTDNTEQLVNESVELSFDEMVLSPPPASARRDSYRATKNTKEIDQSLRQTTDDL